MHQARHTKNASRIARCNRCEACRERKVKCDESWPTCGSCKRRALVCSGPPAAFTHFIAHRSDGTAQPPKGTRAQAGGPQAVSRETPREGLRRHVGSNPPSLVRVREWSTQDGAGVFARFRVQAASHGRRPCILRPPLNTGAGRTAQKLARLLDATTGTQSDVSLRVGWLHLLPARLADGCALADAAELFTSCWTNAYARAHNGLVVVTTSPTAATPFDPATYARAARSIRLALAHQETAFSTDTLAAVALLHLADEQVNGSGSEPESTTTHASGLQALMAARGPPRGTLDELEVRILFETLANLLSYVIWRGGPHFFHRPEWIDAMERALAGGAIPEKESYAHYRLCIFMARWPILAARLKEALSHNGGLPDADEARSLVEDTNRLSQGLSVFEEQHIQPLLRDEAKIRSVEDGRELPLGGGLGSYTFDAWDTCQLFVLHAMISLAVNQMLVTALAATAAPVSPHVRDRLAGLSGRVWKSLAYVKEQAPPRKLQLVTPLILSVEYLDAGSQETLAGEVVSLLGPTRGGRLADQPLAAVKVIGRVLTGRPPFVGTGNSM
ncbi:Zn(2)-C6 fungal-type DNA-binding domain protein [Niveomyces insectorum RCEF 264]|uniref:Zn(2)-C6 fungal-type DNA-binding domain protein n=1 Tax=Niveomyces insectorum RCEF 264 TaxID=1081102 RepID=A0A167S1R5_9HYPO|nr:Zn(2)-C6 fungal-type DNA-binding domain protein [Niveomyces insectorum RCEF 264]